MNIKDTLKDHVLLMDGAMGTYFDRLHPYSEYVEAVELAVIEHPDWIEEIHRKYIEAGADVIRTNTFALNHMLTEDVEKYIHASVQAAKKAVEGKSVFIAVSIGPIRCIDEQEETDVMKEYQHMIDVFLGEGMDIFVFETFSDITMAKKVAAYVKKQKPEAFVITQFLFNKMGYTKYGYNSNRLVNMLSEDEHIDCFGFNCGIGAAHMSELFEGLKYERDCLCIAMPNAGYQQELSGRSLYHGNPKYYAKHMKNVLENGVNIIGGCCGTTPDYIKELRELINKNSVPAKKKIVTNTEENHYEYEENKFIEKLNRGEKVFVVELDAPFGKNADKFVEGAFLLKENHVDMVTISDSPMAKARAEAFQMAIYVEHKTGLTIMPHITCRDRNMIGLHSAFLGGHLNGIRNLLIITGDPVAREDKNVITGVFDFNSIKLMDYVRNMNKEVFGNEPFYYGGALNYAGANIDAIVLKMKKKMDAGCEYFLTQPIFSKENMDRVRELKERTGAKILCGIMPLVSLKNAKFMQNEMPGIQVPEEIVSRYKSDMTREEAEQTAVSISVEIGKGMQDFADGYYIMTPFNRVTLVNRIIKELRQGD